MSWLPERLLSAGLQGAALPVKSFVEELELRQTIQGGANGVVASDNKKAIFKMYFRASRAAVLQVRVMPLIERTSAASANISSFNASSITPADTEMIKKKREDYCLGLFNLLSRTKNTGAPPVQLPFATNSQTARVPNDMFRDGGVSMW